MAGISDASSTPALAFRLTGRGCGQSPALDEAKAKFAETWRAWLALNDTKRRLEAALAAGAAGER
jgi:hypothetical protein